MKKYGKILMLALFAIILVGIFVFLYRKSRPEEIRYEQVRPALKTLQKTTVVTGKIVPRDEINIKPQISGIITELYKEAGESVKEGEVIAKVKVIPEMGSLSSAQSRVRLAEINLKQAEVELGREQSLYDRQLVSQEEYDKVRQTRDQAKEEYDAAVDALEVVRDGVSRSNAKSSSTLIRSTISGLVLDVPVKVGNSVIQSNTFNDGTTIAVVADMNDLIFDGKIDETEVGRLNEGMGMQITIGALQDLSFEAVLEYIAPKAVENNGTNEFQIKAAVNVPGNARIRSGYSANAKIVLEEADSVLAIPESTLEFSGDSIFVYVMGSDSLYARTPVVTGLSDGVNIEVKDGITAEDRLRGNRIYSKK
ncbi:MAG: efflux RND transporter periplasmic adaptor subunit [Candidatus Cryptobacteroides sp.]|nr:efflux RND transporter periplasmic adaptor subunit [Bacteroidales bacterium]